MQARYYDPVIGRFYSNDPVDAAAFLSQGNVHGFNRYAYANNNPYKYIDPDGRNPLQGYITSPEGIVMTQKIVNATTLKVGAGPGTQIKGQVPGVGKFEAGYSASVSLVLSANEAPKVELAASGGATLSNQTGSIKMEGKVAEVQVSVSQTDGINTDKMDGPSANIKMGDGKAGHASTDNKLAAGLHAGGVKVELEIDLDKL